MYGSSTVQLVLNSNVLITSLCLNILQLVHETEDRLKAKEKERDQRIGENEQKMTALKSEVESELKRLADRERENEEKVAKVTLFLLICSAVEIRIHSKLHCMSCCIQCLLLYVLPLMIPWRLISSCGLYK